MKYENRKIINNNNKSFPARGAWIEICAIVDYSDALKSFPARGAWIEIKYRLLTGIDGAGRSPQGERGLKYAVHGALHVLPVVPRKGSVD